MYSSPKTDADVSSSTRSRGERNAITTNSRNASALKPAISISGRKKLMANSAATAISTSQRGVSAPLPSASPRYSQQARIATAAVASVTTQKGARNSRRITSGISTAAVRMRAMVGTQHI